ncbi:MAG: FHA domain-containing protein [Pseudomonadota bacterium]
MSTAIIEINDAGLRAAIDGNICLTSPGYAVMDGDRLLVGEQGQKNARLLPRWTNNRFWNQLNTDPLQGATETVRHHADLAFAHLEQVWTELDGRADQAVFAVPGFYTRQQLGLILGMAKECGIAVAGLADSSLAAVAGQAQNTTLLHLDIFLHRTTLTVLKAGTSLRRLETLTVTDTGLFTLWDRWANTIAGQFIQASRYDPMHQAVSEQRLYDTLPNWIAGLGRARAQTFELDLGTQSYEVVVSQDQLISACATVYPQIVQLIREHVPAGEQACLFVSDRFRGFPGLEDSLSLVTGADLVYLADSSVVEGVNRHLEFITTREGPVSYTTSLPLRRTGAPAASREETARATHLLAGHQAFAIGTALPIAGVADGRPVLAESNARCTLSQRGQETWLEVVSSEGITLNGRMISGSTRLEPGDQVTIDNTTFTLISVS